MSALVEPFIYLGSDPLADQVLNHPVAVQSRNVYSVAELLKMNEVPGELFYGRSASAYVIGANDKNRTTRPTRTVLCILAYLSETIADFVPNPLSYPSRRNIRFDANIINDFSWTLVELFYNLTLPCLRDRTATLRTCKTCRTDQRQTHHD